MRRLFPDEALATLGQKTRAAGIPESSFRGYWHGKHPSHEALVKIIAATGCSADWLVRGRGAMFGQGARPVALGTASRRGASEGVGEEAEAYGTQRLVAVPIVREPGAVCSRRDVGEDDIAGYGVVRVEWCPHPEETFCVVVRDESMAPALPEGSIAAVDCSETVAKLLVGEVVAIRRGETKGVIIRRLYRGPKGRYVAAPDHATPEDTPFEMKAGDRVIGHVRSVHARVRGWE